jgi:hypothetical protein
LPSGCQAVVKTCQGNQANQQETIMNAPLKAARLSTDKAWGVMNRPEKSIFLVKLALMLCSFGWIYGNVLAP